MSASQAEENFTVVINNNGSDGTVSNGQYLSFSNTDGVSRTISVSGATATITPNVSDGVVLDIIYTGKKTVTTSKTKTIVAGNTTVANTGSIADQVDEGQFRINTPNTAVGSSERLPVADVFNIVKIIDSGDPTVDVTNNMISSTANNIINSYTLETGQTDNFYDHSSIKLKPGAPTPKGKLLVIYDYFTHTGSKGAFTVDSYNSAINRSFDGGTKIFSYADIPNYVSPKSGETFNLASTLDFRPLIKESDGTTANPTITRATDDLTTNLVLVPDTDSTTLVNYQYYLPRIDKIVLTRDRQFEVIKGVADVNPSIECVAAIGGGFDFIPQKKKIKGLDS